MLLPAGAGALGGPQVVVEAGGLEALVHVAQGEDSEVHSMHTIDAIAKGEHSEVNSMHGVNATAQGDASEVYVTGQQVHRVIFRGVQLGCWQPGEWGGTGGEWVPPPDARCRRGVRRPFCA